VQYTINGYLAALERSIPLPERIFKLLVSLSNSNVTRANVWRYGPIIESNLTQFNWYLPNFGRLGTALRGATKKVVVAFTQFYQ